MTIEIKFPADRKDIALAIGQALVAIGNGAQATAGNILQFAEAVERHTDSDKMAEPAGPFYWVHHESESYGIAETFDEFDGLVCNDPSIEQVGAAQYHRLVAEWTGDESPKNSAQSATDTTGSGAGSASAGGASQTGKAGGADVPLDEKKVGFNAEFCGKATVPFYGSGKKKGQWKKRQGVSEEAYDEWYAGELLGAKIVEDDRPSATETTSDSKLAAQAFGSKQPAQQTAATGENVPQDAGQLMKWVSEQQAAGNLTPQQVTDVYRALQLPFDAIMNPAYPVAQNCAAIYNHLKGQIK